ncbi:hypothetical protein [Synechococcus phage S-B05]|nr:hypothetical protein [Synechococcus phage S-B05]
MGNILRPFGDLCRLGKAQFLLRGGSLRDPRGTRRP